MVIKALIAARSGSQRVKDKNIRQFADSSLLEIKIKQLKRIKEINGIVVNSNDIDILNLASSLGCEIINRDSYYASDDVSMSEVYRNMAENMDSEVIAYTNCTNPLVSDKSIADMIKKYEKICDSYDSLNSAHVIKEFLFKDNKPINYDLQNQPRSQDLPDIMALNFAVNIISKQAMIKQKNVVGIKPYLYCIDEIEATDIDNPIDFDFAEYVYKKNS